MQVSTLNNTKVYDLSSTKSTPQWTSEAQKRSLAKDEEYRRRVELIQDFEMPTTTHCITMTNNGEYIIATGGYPPMIRCYALSDLSMKFQRGLTCDVVAMKSLSDDYAKMVLLQGDRTLAFHAPYGAHHSLRVPKFGRDLAYGAENCDLYVAASGDEVYRLNLEAGQFKEPISLDFVGCNKVCINPMHRLLACGGERGMVEFHDARSKKRVAQQYVGSHINRATGPAGDTATLEITALTWDTDGLTLGVGTSDGNVLLYDIRSSKPLLVKEHQYGLPMVDISFHNSSRHIISTDKKVAKIWQRDGDLRGQILTNVETPADINAALLVRDKSHDSGLLMMAGEQSRIMTYFVPQLGPAPAWCSYLDGLTEELEEEQTSTVYEDFKFLTKLDVEELGATSLVGTEHLRAYMHGYFMEMKMYQSLRAVARPFEYQEHLKKRVKEKLEAKRQSRIIPKKKLPKVNKELAEKFMRQADKERRAVGSSSDEEGGADDEEKRRSKKKGDALVDERFASLFNREEFQQDPESLDYLLRNPTQSQRGRQALRDDDEEDDLHDMYTAVSDDDDDDDNDDESDSEEERDNGFGAPSGESDDFDSDIEIKNPDIQEYREAGVKSTLGAGRKKKRGGTGESDEEEGAIARASKKAALKQKGRGGGKREKADIRSKPGFYELSDSYAGGSASFSSQGGGGAGERKRKKEESSVPLVDRVAKLKGGKRVKARGNMKELEYVPKKKSK